MSAGGSSTGGGGIVPLSGASSIGSGIVPLAGASSTGTATPSLQLIPTRRGSRSCYLQVEDEQERQGNDSPTDAPADGWIKTESWTAPAGGWIKMKCQDVPEAEAKACLQLDIQFK